MQRMQQASNIPFPAAFRRAAQIVAVMIALGVMFFASCMMVSAHETYAAVQQGGSGHGIHAPSPTAPEPVTF
jgi:hypothetical protein